MKIGVLALQGDVREHIQSLSDCGVDAIAVKTQNEIESISALVIPGGESTTIAKLARSFDLFDLIKERINGGMPTYGSCAGMILLSNQVEDAIAGQESFGGIATPADAAMMMQLGADGVFVGSGIFKSGDPAKRAAACVKAVTYFTDAKVVAEVSRGLGEAMVGINVADIPVPHRLAERGW